MEGVKRGKRTAISVDSLHYAVLGGVYISKRSDRYEALTEVERPNSFHRPTYLPTCLR